MTYLDYIKMKLLTKGAAPFRMNKNTITLLSIVAGVAMMDFLFWNHPVGCSLGVMVAALVALIIINRPSLKWGAASVFSCLLLLSSGLQSAIKVNFFNCIVISVLLLNFTLITFYRKSLLTIGLKKILLPPLLWLSFKFAVKKG